MTLTLDPATEQRLQRELARGIYDGSSDLINRALSLVEAEEDWLIRNREAINADLEVSSAEAERGEGSSPEVARKLLSLRHPA